MKSTRFARHFEQNDQITTTGMLCDQRFNFEGNFLLKGFFWKIKEI